MNRWFRTFFAFVLILPLGKVQLCASGEDGILPDSVSQLPIEAQLQYLNDVGDSLEVVDPINGLKIFSKGRELSQNAKELAWQAVFDMEISHILYNSGNYDKSLEYAFEGFALADSADDLSNKAWSTHRIALAYADLNDTANALKYGQMNLKLRLELDDIERLPAGYNALGEIYRLNQHHDEADAAYLKADSIYSLLKDTAGLHMIRHNRALVFTATGKYQEAIDSLNQTWSVTWPERNFNFTLEAAIALSECYANLGQWSRAEKQLNDGLDLAREKGSLKFKQMLFEQQARIFRMNGKWEKAWEAREQSIATERMIKGFSVQMQSNLLGLQSENQRMEAENQLLLEKQKSQSIFLILLAVITSLILVSAFFVLRSNRKTRTANLKLEEQNQKLDALNEEKDLLMKVVAHDLKSPLTNISGLVSLLDQMADTPAMREQLMDKIRQSVNRGTELIENLLELSTLESGKVPVNWERIDVKKISKEVLSGYAERAEQKNIAMKFDASGDFYQTWSDPSHVHRILDNLISNALKYSPQGTEIATSLKASKAGFSVKVSDQGPGISPEEQKKLFRKFEKLSTRPTGGESSTGLGLAIVKALSSQIHADIKVASKVGEGSSFELQLPLRSDPPTLS